MGSDKKQWVADSLAAIPLQPTVTLDALSKIFLDLTATNSS